MRMHSTLKGVPTHRVRSLTVKDHRNTDPAFSWWQATAALQGGLPTWRGGQHKSSDSASLLRISKAYMVYTVCQELLKVLFKYKPLSRIATR